MNDELDAFEDEENYPIVEERSKNLGKTKKIKEKLLDLYNHVEKGFVDQLERAGDTQDYWDIYNCTLGQNQFYSGQSRIFSPMVYNAINARITRFVNQIFPKSGRNVEVVTTDGTFPDATITLLEHYIRKSTLRTTMPAILLNGDVEGQINLYVEWSKRERHVVRKVKKAVELQPGLPVPDEFYEDIEETTVKAAHPIVDVIADTDVCVIPPTVASLEEAIDVGGAVAILRRWSKEKIRTLVDDGQIDKEEGESLIEEMSSQDAAQTPNKAKTVTAAAGIRGTGDSKFALVYEVWSKVKTQDGLRICKSYFGGSRRVLSCVRNPLWCDRLPLISAPIRKVQGSFKGMSLVHYVADMQYLANDTINEGADSMAYSLLPIVMTDPEKNPKIANMVLTMAAVWPTSPKDTQFVQFPALWRDAFEIAPAIKQEIFQTLSVNPSQITQGTKKKQSQAEVANEQQVDILTTADAVTVIEEAVLNKVLELFLEMDHQYRDETIQIQAFGELGMKAQMQDIEPIQLGTRYEFKWLGVETARNMQQVQQQIAFMNVLKGIPPQMYQGYKLNMAPLLKQLTESTFGSRLAPLIFEDIRTSLSVDVDKENALLQEGHFVPVHPMDNHKEHYQSHLKDLEEKGDPHGVKASHLLEHQMAMMEQAAAQQQAIAPKGLPGGPGGAGPGVAGAPRPGAQPQVPHGGQQPPGMVRQDQMQDPSVMPRRM